MLYLYTMKLIITESQLKRLINENEEDPFDMNTYNKRMLGDNIINMFVGALEGGSNYWYHLRNVPTEVKQIMKQENLAFSEAIGRYILDGGRVTFYDAEDREEVLGYVDMDKITKALDIIKNEYPDIYEAIVEEQGDAGTDDVFLQIAVMGDIVFG